MLPLCREEGIGVIPWSPLARGFLAGNRRSAADADTARGRTDTFGHGLYYAPEDFTVAARCADVARDKGVKPAQVALAWILRQPGTTAPIIGASQMHQLDEAVDALSITLSDEDARRLEQPYVPHRVLGH
jgi:aryl-alcohol dehydrogenase (NADP+)